MVTIRLNGVRLSRTYHHPHNRSLRPQSLFLRFRSPSQLSYFALFSTFRSLHPFVSRSTGCVCHQLLSGNMCFPELQYARFYFLRFITFSDIYLPVIFLLWFLSKNIKGYSLIVFFSGEFSTIAFSSVSFGPSQCSLEPVLRCFGIRRLVCSVYF